MNPILAIEWGMFGVFLTSFVLLAFFTMIKPLAPIYEMKSLFASKAVIGALIALAAKVWGLKTGVGPGGISLGISQQDGK